MPFLRVGLRGLFFAFVVIPATLLVPLPLHPLVAITGHLLEGISLAPRRLDHLTEVAPGLFQQQVRHIELHGHAGVHHNDAVRVHDSVQSVGNCEDCALLELDANGALDQAISSGIGYGG